MAVQTKEGHLLQAWQATGWSKGTHKGERKMLIDLLDDGEQVGSMVGGMFGPDLGDAGKLGKNGSLHKGIVVATQSRVLFVDKGIFSTEVAVMPYDSIETIANSSGLIKAGVKLTGRGTASYQIQMVKKTEVKPFVDYVRAQVAASRVSATSSAQAGSAAELASLYALVGQGVLTEAEFEAKKRQLLGI